MANLSLMFKVTWANEEPIIRIRRLDKLTFCLSVEESDGKLWYQDIKCYLENQSYPPCISNWDKKILRRLASNFFLNGDVVYKRNHDTMLFRCVDRHEADLLIKEIHEGSFGTHVNRHAMAKKILMASYYWLTMESNYFRYVKKCHKC